MWACACANWTTLDDINKYQNKGSLEDHCIFVEPVDKKLILPDTIGYSGDIVEYTGQFYIDKGFPKNYIQNEEPVEKAKVFRYSTYKIIKSNFRDFINAKDK